jgi:hypothetical protein
MEQTRWLRDEARDTGCLGINPNSHKTAESIENQTAVGATPAPAVGGGSGESRRQPFKDEFNESLAMVRPARTFSIEKSTRACAQERSDREWMPHGM